MDNQRRIALATANRAERGILEPLIRRLQEKAKQGEIQFQLLEKHFNDRPWQGYFDGWMLNGTKPDVILIPADRKEMVELAKLCYYNSVPIFHMWAGIGSTNTWDDLNRRVISSFSYLMFAEDEECRQRLVSSGEEEWRCITTGTTHMDDLEVDESLVPNEEYDLGLLNTNPFEEQGPALMQRLWPRMLPKRYVIWIGGDGGNNFPAAVAGPGASMKALTNLPRSQFLGLLKNCRRFISNSSSCVYEAPYFGVEVVHVGKRNSGRRTHFVKYPQRLSIPPSEPSLIRPSHLYNCASDYIDDLLVNYPIDKSKLLKVYK